MNDTKWFGLAIVASAAIVIANVAFGVERVVFVGGLFAVCLAAVVSLRGSQTHFGWMLVVTQATSPVLALIMSLYLLATDEGTRRKLNFSDLMMIFGVIFALVSLAIGVGAWLLAFMAHRYQRKHSALSVGLFLFVVTASVTFELLERWESPSTPEPPTLRIDPPNN